MKRHYVSEKKSEVEQLSEVQIRKESKNPQSGNTKGGSITVKLTSCLTGLESAV